MSNDINNPLYVSQKSFKLFRLMDRENNFFEKNIRLTKFTGILFIPFCKTRDELIKNVKQFFGLKGYNQWFTNYLFDYKFVYQPSFYSKPRKLIKNEKNKITDELNVYLPYLKNPPSYVYRNNRNSIVDYTPQFKYVFPEEETLLKQPVLKYSENIFPEIMCRFMLSSDNLELDKWCSKYKSTNNDPFININHDTVLIPINVNITNNAIVNQYLDYTKNIPLSVKKNLNYLRVMSLCRFIYRAYANDIEDSSDESLKHFIKTVNDKNVIFLIHNDTFSFSINFKELRSKDIKIKQFYNMFKSRLIMLVSNNTGIQDSESLDMIIKEEDEEESKKVNKIDQDINININKDTKEKDIDKSEPVESNDEIKDHEKERNIKMINKILKTETINTNSSKYANSLAKKTAELNKLIEENTDTKLINDLDYYKNEMDNIDKAEPVEDEEIDDTPTQEDEVYLTDEVETSDTEYTNTDDIDEDILKEEKQDIQITSTGELTEEEKEELLKEINKKQTPKKSEKQLRRISQVRDMYKSIKLEDNRTLEEIINDVNAVQIDKTGSTSENVIDKSTESCTLQDFENSYIKKTMKSDIVKVFKSFSDDNKSIPLNIIEYKEEDTSDRFNSKTTITVKFEDEDQKQHTIKVDMPKPNKDGTLLINGNKKILKKQITLLPIVKIEPDRLAINTYYNKVLMFRQGTVLNRTVVAIKKMVENYTKEKESKFVVKYGNNLNANRKYITTIEYDELAKHYFKFLLGPKGNRTVVFFNQNDIREEISRLNIPYIYNVNKLPIAISYSDKSVIEFNLKETNFSVGEIIIDLMRERAGLAGFDESMSKVKIPKRRIYSRCTIQSFDIPTVAFLGALYGIRNVMRVNKLKFTFSTKPLRNDNRLTIKFKDGILYYPEYPLGNSLLFNGLTELPTEEFTFDEFDTPDPYIEWAYLAFKNRNIYKGWTCFKELFIDMITKEILESLKLPTDFLELFLYANELLTDNSYVHETRAESYRIRGYETLCVGLYKALAHEYAIYKQKETKARGGITIPQDILFTTLNNSEILENLDTINPINELKMKSTCTFKGVGVGGVNVKHGFTLERRGFGEDAAGIFGASNVDNGSVGVTKELTTNPRILSTRGFIEPTDTKSAKELTAGERLSPEELIMPAINKFDHPNRVAFSSAQWKHTLPIYGGGDPPLIGSGFEKTMVKHIGDTFSLRAANDGKVIDINEELKIVVVEYKDGSKETFRYGRDFVRNSNFFLENDMVLNVKVGDKITKNDVLVYSRDFFNKTIDGELTFTMGKLCRVAIMEDYFTEEDSSLISEDLSMEMSTSVTKRKVINIKDRSNIIKYAKVGDYVKDGETIFMFEDESTEDDSSVNEILELLGDVDEEALENMAYHSPKANATGTITKLEVYWTGDIENMSDSCRKFINEYIREKKKLIKFEEEQTGKKSDKEFEIKKSSPKYGKIGVEELDDDGILIEYYITHVTPYGNGDKLSFSPAIKSVTGQIVPKELAPYTENGDPVDAVMGLVSLSARQVNSPYFIGSLSKVILDVSKQIADEYLGKK